MLTVKMKIDVPKDWQPGDCIVCPFKEIRKNKHSDYCSIDPHERAMWCILEVVE